MKRISPDSIYRLKDKEVFVFGSNIHGMHGGGAARFAYEHFGAEWGVGEGLTGGMLRPAYDGRYRVVPSSYRSIYPMCKRKSIAYFFSYSCRLWDCRLFSGASRTLVRRRKPFRKCIFAEIFPAGVR